MQSPQGFAGFSCLVVVRKKVCVRRMQKSTGCIRQRRAKLEEQGTHNEPRGEADVNFFMSEVRTMAASSVTSLHVCARMAQSCSGASLINPNDGSWPTAAIQLARLSGFFGAPPLTRNVRNCGAVVGQSQRCVRRTETFSGAGFAKYLSGLKSEQEL